MLLETDQGEKPGGACHSYFPNQKTRRCMKASARLLWDAIVQPLQLRAEAWMNMGFHVLVPDGIVSTVLCWLAGPQDAAPRGTRLGDVFDEHGGVVASPLNMYVLNQRL